MLTTSVMIDVATQLRRPTGHALNPVPLSEAERIPDADEILEVHLMARELEIEVRRGAPLLDWAWAERRAAEAVAYARAFRDGALAHFADAGADPGDAGALLLALRRTTPAALERAHPHSRLARAARAGDVEARRRRHRRRACAAQPPAARRSRGSCSRRWRCTTWSATRSRESCRRRARR